MIVMASILVLSLAGIADSLYLFYEHLGHEVMCLTDTGCAAVDASPYSELAGVPVSLLGLGSYLALFALTALGLRYRSLRPAWIHLGIFGISLVGVLYSAYLTYLELYVIHAVCSWCVISAGLIALIFALSLFGLRAERAGQTPRSG